MTIQTILSLLIIENESIAVWFAKTFTEGKAKMFSL